MSLSMILATDLNGAIGRNNGLLTHIPEDLKHFKELTEGKVIVMGRKTAESLPNGRPLPNRVNIVMTRNLPSHDFSTPKEFGFIYCKDFEKILKIAETEDVFIIGGAEIYKLFEKYVETIYWTLLEKEFEGADTFYEGYYFNKNISNYPVEILSQSTFGEGKTPMTFFKITKKED